LLEFLDRREEVAVFFDAGEGFVGAEFQEIRFFLFQASLDFVPADWSGNGRLLLGAKRINADGGFMFVVLAPIDEHFSFAGRFRHIRRDKIGMLVFEMLRESAR
jgi:ABC-type uncharacterized transport system permease subunit